MLDVDATTDVVVGRIVAPDGTVVSPGRTFRVSGIPAGIAHGLDFRSTKALAPLREHVGPDGKPLPGHEDAIAAVQVMVDAEWLETAREWIRWGLRSYAGAAGGKTVRQFGRDWVLLSDEACERIVRAEGGFLALGLAREIAAKQRVSAEEALGFLSPSGSA